ncbi:MAG: hypothetical protein NTV94_17900 [Planctomycetota bacterium]|nr:hypothetical protein [Planctomycetota bacterium]
MTCSRRGITRALLIALASLLILLNILCLPLYSGASISPRFHWRLEHGRLTLRATPPFNTETFYIALNSEGLRFIPEAQFNTPSDWSLTVPLWIPALACITGALLLRRGSCNNSPAPSSPDAATPPSGSC